MTRKEAASWLLQPGIQATFNDPHTKEAIRRAIKALGDPERKTGKWIKQTKFGRLECDICGHVFKAYFRPRNFCPNCGADMKGEQDE